ncbi:MAG: cell division protein FtsZ [Oscillospiraceae bacterium]|nr:cell division protein FtsZ [Oscillospiraceae bacterium]
MAEIINMKVVGVGGAGSNVVSRMKRGGMDGVGYACINTDRSALSSAAAEEKLQIGERLTKGQGAGSRPEVGLLAAEEGKNAISKLFEDVDAVFLTAGMGGGTGTGASPVVAEAARAAGALTIGVVSLPFRWEGARKMRTAEQGVQALLEQVDTLFVIPNDNLGKIAGKVSFAKSFDISDEILNRAVGGIADLLRSTGFINLDFADLKTVLRGSGLAHLGIGEASGKSKVEEAAAQVIRSELMETGIAGARRLIVNVIISQDLPMDDVSAVMERIQAAAHPDANIIFGIGFDEKLVDALRVIVIATDFDGSAVREADAAAAEEVAQVAEKQRTAPPAGTEGDAQDDDWEVWKKFFD